MNTNYAPSANLKISQRSLKAEKINAILSKHLSLTGKRVLDIGTGAGLVPDRLSRSVGAQGEVYAVDRIDQRKIKDSYGFKIVEDTSLPFSSDHFNVVISNHVIEHVGNSEQQQHHLREIFRVLKKGGFAYLAMPNKYALVEPHYKLPFLSWLPRKLADYYVRSKGKGEFYRWNPPRYSDLVSFISGAGFSFQNVTIDSIPLMLEIEKPSGIKKVVMSLPGAVFSAFRFFLPTRILILRKE